MLMCDGVSVAQKHMKRPPFILVRFSFRIYFINPLQSLLWLVLSVAMIEMKREYDSYYHLFYFRIGQEVMKTFNRIFVMEKSYV